MSEQSGSAEQGMDPGRALEVLRIRAATLEECAEQVDADPDRGRPDLARKWRREAEGLRALTDN